MTPATRTLRFRSTRFIALAAAASAALLGGSAGPAAAAPKEPLSYVALGDSYASGFGAGSYVNACGQSPLGLPGILDAKKQIDLVADATCAGAKVATEPGGAIDLQEQLAALSADTDLVTISAGGNDAGFGTVAGVCVTQPTEVCQQVIAATSATALPVLAANLDALYDSIQAAAPNATVVVTGYPHLFSPEFGNALIPLASQEAFNQGTDALNALIREQAEAHGFLFVDLVPRFEGHGIGSPDSWIVSQLGAVDILHPTAEGYRSGYYPAVRSAVNFAQLQR
ncbi:SGNH/GDSL hydrolase family protein [Arthrobacter sp. MDB2-24]